MPQFKYKARNTCVCGESLPSNRKIIKKTAWGEVHFIQCSKCGSWIQAPQIDIQSLKDWYDSDEYQGSTTQKGSIYLNYINDEPFRLAEARHRYRTSFAHMLKPKSRVLEIGCASASLLAAFRENGHGVTGVDLSERFAALAKQTYNIEVLVTDLLSAQFPDDHFDMILMFGTICNLVDLPASLKKIGRMLHSDGHLVFNYPACNSWLSRLYGKNFWMFTPSINAFLSDRGCDLVLNQCGFGILQRQQDWQQPSFSKLLKHARLEGLIRFLPRGHLPCSIPIPMVRQVIARKLDQI
jgi:SAM-dependent methyltransferase